MSHLEIRLLGEPELLIDGKPADLRAPRAAWSLIALLVLSPIALRRAALASALWPDKEDASARSTLRRILHLVTLALPPSVRWMKSDAKSIAWNHDAPARVDALEFERAIAQERLADAAGLYAGDLLGTECTEAAHAAREQLRTMYLEALASLTQTMRGVRNFEAGARYAELLLAADPWREDAVRALMKARYQGGDRSGALLAYERFAEALQHELQAQPMDDTKALRTAILSGSAIAEDLAADCETGVLGGGLAGWKAPLVGRVEDLERLRAAWSRAVRKSGGVVFISGEAGIGKSRLAAELVDLVREQNGRALMGSTSNPEGAPYQSIAGALRGGLASFAQSGIDEPWLAELSAVLPEIRGVVAVPPEFEVSEDDRARERLFEAFVRIVELLGRVRPLCLVLEDLHWAGHATIDLLGWLARRAGTLPVLIVATYRARDPGGDLVRDLRAALVRERRAHSIALERLAPSEIASVVHAAVDDPAIRHDAQELVTRLSEGNPLFVVQLLEGFRETGLLPDAGTALRTLGEAIAVRTERVTANARAVAETAATIGETFGADVVAGMGGWDERTVLDAIGELIDRGLARESGGGGLEYAFTHALVAASFYERSDPKVRVARHRRAAQTISRVGSDDRNRLEAIARHWQLANESQNAAGAYIRAAKSALEIHARNEAVAYAHTAAELAPDDATRFEALVIASSAQIRKGTVASWHADLTKLEAAAKNLGEKERFEALRQRSGYAAQTADSAAGERCIEGMLAIAREAKSEQLLFEALSARGYLEMMHAEMGKSIASSRSALEVALRLGDAGRAMRIRNTLIQALVRHGDFVSARIELDAQRVSIEEQRYPVSADLRLGTLTAEATIASMIEDGPLLEALGTATCQLAREVGDVFFEARGHTMLAHGAYFRQDIDATRHNYDRALELFAQVDAKQQILATYVNRSELERRIGRVVESLRFIDLAIVHANASPTFRDFENVLIQNRAAALLIVGPPDEAMSVARIAYASSLEITEPRLIVDALTILGAAELQNGLVDAAIGHLTEAIERCRGREDWFGAASALSWLVEAYVTSGRTGEASASAAELARMFDEGATLLVQPTHVCWAMASYAQALGQASERDAWVSRGVALVGAALEKLTDPADVDAYSSLRHNRSLLEAKTASTR